MHLCLSLRLLQWGGGAEGEGSGSKSVRPSVYDGKTSWEAYLTQFKLLSELNHWTEQQKATYLAINLQGPALTVLTNLLEEQRGDFTALAAALKNHFGNNHQAELNRAHLCSRTKKRDESLHELAEDVQHLIRLAYPEAGGDDDCCPCQGSIHRCLVRRRHASTHQAESPTYPSAGFRDSIGIGVLFHGEQEST